MGTMNIFPNMNVVVDYLVCREIFYEDVVINYHFKRLKKFLRSKAIFITPVGFIKHCVKKYKKLRC